MVRRIGKCSLTAGDIRHRREIAICIIGKTDLSAERIGNTRELRPAVCERECAAGWVSYSGELASAVVCERGRISIEIVLGHEFAGGRELEEFPSPARE